MFIFTSCVQWMIYYWSSKVWKMVFDDICEPFKPLFVGCGVLRGYLLDKILSFYSNMDLIGSKNEKTKRPPIKFQLSLGFTLCAKNTSTAHQIWSFVSTKGQRGSQLRGKNHFADMGGFQLLDLIITQLKSHMTC